MLQNILFAVDAPPPGCKEPNRRVSVNPGLTKRRQTAGVVRSKRSQTRLCSEILNCKTWLQTQDLRSKERAGWGSGLFGFFAFRDVGPEAQKCELNALDLDSRTALCMRLPHTELRFHDFRDKLLLLPEWVVDPKP